MKWDRRFKAFLLEHSTLSDATIVQNVSRVRGFDRWLKGNADILHGNITRIKSYGRPAAAEDNLIRGYFKYLQESHHPADYRQHIKTALRYYYKFLIASGTIKQIPDLTIPIRKNGGDTGKEKRLLTDQQIETLREDGFYSSLRDTAMFMCLVDLGIRIHELVMLRARDFDYDLNQVTIRSTKTEGKKYGGQRVMPLSPRLADLVMRHVAGNLGYKPDILFHITEGQVWRIIKKAGKANGMPWLHPHLFRHYCITRFCQTTGDDNITPVFRPKEVSMMFGVSPSVISKIYDHPDTENIVSKALNSVYSSG
ncbi:MAG TPA: hypothetical protein ENI27_06095 [bacterium]|nr:hypothetical protein [bacterium]